MKNIIKQMSVKLCSLFLPKQRAQCLLGEGSVLYPTARVVSLQDSSSRISIGKNCHIRGELLLFAHGGNISMGDYCYVGENTRIWSALSIRIGQRVLISHNCNIFDSDTHPLDPVERHRQFVEIITTGHPKNGINLNEKEIVIEDDVLIGTGSIILKGVTIGRAAIVGAGSVVTESVPPYTVVAGNPARPINNIKETDK